MFTRSLDQVINSRVPSGQLKHLGRAAVKATWNFKVAITAEARFELDWWIYYMPLMAGMPIESLHAK